jgi:hypothetical protein
MGLLDTVEAWVTVHNAQDREASQRLITYLLKLEHVFEEPPNRTLDGGAALAALMNESPAEDLEYLASRRGRRGATAQQITTKLRELRRQIDERTVPDQLSFARERSALRMGVNPALVPMLKALAYVLPVVAAYLFGVYYRARPGMYLTAEALLWPPYHVSDHGALEPDAEYQRRFFTEFSKYYFDRDNTFSNLTRNDAESDPMLVTAARVLVTLRNPSRAEPLLIGSVTVHRRFIAAAFPWQRVEDTPKVSIAQDRMGFMVGDSGVGPAINLQYAVTAGHVAIASQKAAMLYHDTLEGSLWDTDTGILIRHVINERLDLPFYRAAMPHAAGATELCAGRWFEQISTIPRLKQLTNVAFRDEAMLRARYESLRGIRRETTGRITLPLDQAYVRRKPELLEWNPCLPQPPEPARPPKDITTVAPPPPPPLEILAPKDVADPQLIISTVRMDLKNDEQVTVLPEQILKPGGYLHLRLNLTEYENGLYEIEVRVNGERSYEFRLATLHPDEFRFSPSDLAGERARFTGVKNPSIQQPFKAQQ